jgi:hypothetical protein
VPAAMLAKGGCVRTPPRLRSSPIQIRSFLIDRHAIGRHAPGTLTACCNPMLCANNLPPLSTESASAPCLVAAHPLRTPKPHCLFLCRCHAASQAGTRSSCGRQRCSSHIVVEASTSSSTGGDAAVATTGVAVHST